MPLLLKNAEPPAARGPGLFDDVDKLLKLKELFSGANDTEKDDMFTSLLKALAPAGAALLAKAGGMPGTMPAQVVALPQGAPAAPAGSGGALAPNPVQLALPMLVSAARKGGEPELYHDLIAEQLNDLQYEQLVQLLEKPDWCAQLFGNPPEIAADQKVKDWFEALRKLFITPDAGDDAGELQPAENDAPIQ
jgi:hypothetical protein